MPAAPARQADARSPDRRRESLSRTIPDPVEALLRDLLEWMAPGERRYAEVMEAWRTACPRLPVWEEANERGFVERANIAGQAVVRITPAGRAFLTRL